MAVANDQLRAARERTASPTYPDECPSRQELAELVNAYIWDHHHTMRALDANHLGKMERGSISWPSRLYREALREVLGVPTDAALGFVNTRRATVRLDDVKRKQFLHAAALGVGTLALGGSVAALLEGGEPTPVPARVGATEIAQVRTAAQVFQSWDFTGGGPAREAVLAQLRWSAGLLEASCPARLRPELFSAVGALAETTGYRIFDAGAHEEARRVFRFALACAEQADDWHLRAKVLASMAGQEVWTGRPDQGLTLVEQALVRGDRLTATEKALLHAVRAGALAPMRRVRETLIAVGTADDHFAHSIPANDPPFMTYYGAAMHAGITGRALTDLALHDRSPAQATDRLTTAVAGHTAGFARARAISQTKLASLTMTTGDPVEAAVIGNAALDAAGTIRSHRAADGLRELARHATRHPTIDQVAALRQRISTTLLTS